MDNVDIGETITIDDVLLVGSRRTTIIGQPIVKSAQVLAQVEEITKDKKVIAFKMRRRKNSKSTVGHRRDIVILRINDIIIDKNIENLGLENI
jgi:large subunit ribosomal protein L21